MKRSLMSETILLAFCLLALYSLLNLSVEEAPDKLSETSTLRVYSTAVEQFVEVNRVVRSDDSWRQILTPKQYFILREQGTEPRRSGIYNQHDQYGTYVCAGCGQDLFRSVDKFASTSGWPSFHSAVAPENIIEERDLSLRIEVRCSRCNGHLGHVFEDGPPPTGLRYCINSGALGFMAGSGPVQGQL